MFTECKDADPAWLDRREIACPPADRPGGWMARLGGWLRGWVFRLQWGPAAGPGAPVD